MTSVNSVSGTGYPPRNNGVSGAGSNTESSETLFETKNGNADAPKTESSEVTALKQERSQLEAKYQQLENKQTRLETKKENLENRQANLEKQLAQIDQKIQKAEQQKAAAENDVRELTEAYNKDKEQIIKLAQDASEQVSQLLNETEKQTKERKDKNKATIEKVMEKYEKGEISKEDVGRLLQMELEKDYADNGKKLNGLNIIDVACAEIKGLSSAMAGIYDQIAAKQAEIQSLTTAIADYKVTRENISNEIVVVKSEINEIIPELNNVNKEMTTVQKDVNKVDAKIAREDASQQPSQVATGSTYYQEEQLLVEGSISHTAYEERERLRDNPFESIMPTDFSMQIELLMNSLKVTKEIATELLNTNKTEARDEDVNAREDIIATKPEEEKDDNKVNGKKDGSDDEKEKEDEEETVGV